MSKLLNNCGGGQFMDMILMTCGLDVDNMLIFGPYFAHIFSVNLKVRSTNQWLKSTKVLRFGAKAFINVHIYIHESHHILT